jgi:ribonuclease HI
VPEILASQGLGILSHFPQEKDTPVVCIVQVESIDFSRPWDFFDGASQKFRCGGGTILYLSDHHLFKIKMGLGSGSNNLTELMSLKLLLLFVGEKGIKSIHLFGDSMNVVNWVRKAQRCQNILLQPLLDEIFIYLNSFDSFSVKHIYREHNTEADSLSKDGIQL